MVILGALPGDIQNWFYRHDEEAGRRVLYGYYLWPRLMKQLEQLEVIRTVHGPIPPPPGPEVSAGLLEELASVLLTPYFGDPSPQPNFPAEFRLKVTATFRDGLHAFVKELDDEIQQLERQVE